ncbi:hypothetical protein F5877DRAFT_21793, partial [Lentinula edodes]
LPNFIGKYFPRRDDPASYPLYCAAMLLLLKPWRNIANDLKRPTETWEEVFKEFVETCPKQNIDIMSGIQYYYECESA